MNAAHSDAAVRFAEDDAAFQALELYWRTLDAAPGVHPFQQFGWIAAWRRTLGAGEVCRLHVATYWSSGQLVAVLPLCIRRFKGLRMLEWMAAEVSDYCDGIATADDAGTQALSLLWQAVEARGGYDIARLRHVRFDARIGEILEASKPWSETREHAGGIPIVWRSGEQWLQSCSKKMRDNVNYKVRRMSKAGFAARLWPQDQGCGEILDILAAQKRPWLAQRSLSGPICTAAGLEFLKLAAAHAAGRGELHLSVVANAECVAAVDLGFVRSGRIYSYMASFDERFAKYSFGRLLTDQFIMWSCDQGMGRFDLMLGAYDYKQEYGCTLEPVTTQVLARSWPGRAALAFYRRSRKSDQ